MSESVITNLAEVRNRLVNEIHLLSLDKLNKKPSDEMWSIAQVCHHLFLAERGFTKSIIYGLKQTNGEKAAPKPIHIAANRTRKAKAPDMVIPSGEPLEAQKIIEMLDESRSIFLEVYSRIEDKTILAERSAKHPLFGQLPLDQWVELLGLHEQRHIEQIKEIKTLIN